MSKLPDFSQRTLVLPEPTMIKRTDHRPLMAHGLMFHHFHDAHKHIVSQGSINAAELTAMIKFYQKTHNVLSAEEWLKRACQHALSPKDVCLTFDDSLRCQYDVAFPVLEKLGIKAFWLIYTAPLVHNFEKIEMYRYFRTKEFADIEEFYQAFDQAVAHSTFKEACTRGLKQFDPEAYLKDFTFYSRSDKRFRYVRDRILGKDNYCRLMDAMMADHGFDEEAVADILWMDGACLRDLKKHGHLIGLHSHSHPYNMGELSRITQEAEYNQNHRILQQLIEDDIVVMSHPCNSYNEQTLDILKKMGIQVGFCSNMAKVKHSALEFPRLDHAYLIKEIK